jgi:hypothetical protein
MFPSSYAAQIGLDLRRGRRYEFSGAGSHSQLAHFFDLRVAILSTHRPILFQTQIGFTNALEGAGIGLLGQNGFFDKFRVTFDLPKGVFVINPTRRRG